jgi:hypothetical protein
MNDLFDFLSEDFIIEDNPVFWVMPEDERSADYDMVIFNEDIMYRILLEDQ